MEINPVEPAMLPPGELRMRVDTILEQEKQPILELYRFHPIDELLQYLRILHGVSVQRKQLIYKLGIWGASKDTTRDKADFSSLLGQHIVELVKTGSLFADSITKGYHLFKWANEAGQIIQYFRINGSHDTLSPSSLTKLLEDLDELITDEHPQLMRVLFGVWDGITQIDDTKTASRYFIDQVYALCQKLLGKDSLITKAFDCLQFGHFKPAECLELLELLPAKIFAQRSESLGPNFQTNDKTDDKTNDATSDYQTASSESRNTARDFWTRKPQTLKPNFGNVERSDYLGESFLLAHSGRKSRRQIDPVFRESKDLQVLASRHPPENNDEQEGRYSRKGLPLHFTNTSIHLPPSLVVSPQNAKDFAATIFMRSQTKLSIECSDELDTEDSWPPQRPGHVSPPVLEHVGQSSIKTFGYNPSKNSLEGIDFDVLELSDNQTSDCQTPDHESPDYRLKTQSTWSPHENERQVAVGESSVSQYGESDIASDSTADKQQQQMRAREAERRQIVQTVMDAFIHDLDSHLEDITGSFVAIKEEDAGEPAQVSPQAEGSTMRERSQMPRKRHKSCDGKQGTGGWRDQGKSGDKDECDESDNEEDGGKKRTRKVPRCRDEMGGILFACPFFKWNPLAYVRKKDCSGPGWESVHRVKEHLYRRHERPPFQCSRCCNWFDKQSALDWHLRVGSIDQLCDIINESDLLREFKFGPDAKRQLKVKSSPKQTEAERWKAVYRILFDVREDEIPTPYYDHDITALGREESWKEYARREIMILLRQRIEAEVEQRFANVEPELIAGLRGVVHDLELTMRRNFERRQEEARNLNRRGSPSMRPPPPPPPPPMPLAALDESSTNTARTPGNDEGEVAAVPQTVLNTDNNLAGHLSLDDSQQEVHSARSEATGMDTLNWRFLEGEEPLDPSLLDADFDFDFLNYDGGNSTF
ncbi:hypothetical protein CTAM01_03367 [Colletotrichum tamarilloi]|uniref:C2H2-type domain-containing protein n=1 Tax=Colletotrichum tamarilloi TaxID=1209934 RepID=A0ABQ9RJK3_9PEZI|nr:uncharacterized protein CTAM01_03367 [Colletotrichum tamarilloi]KAK1506032.1 hypothetical protein CTAM01_03367 [Colletotrichum tamarilloi]